MTEALALLALAAVALVIVAVCVVRSGIHHTREQARQAHLEAWERIGRSIHPAAVNLIALGIVSVNTARTILGMREEFGRDQKSTTPIYDELRVSMRGRGIRLTDESDPYRITRAPAAHALDRLTLQMGFELSTPQRAVILRHNDGA